MGLGQWLKRWLTSGSGLVRFWKWWLVLVLVLYPLGQIISPLMWIWDVLIIMAIPAFLLSLAGLSVKGRARANAEEYFKVKEEREAKKERGL